MLFAIVFLSKNGHGLVKYFDIINAVFFGALTLVMDNSGIGKIVIFIPSLYNAVTQINVFAIHEKRFIEQAYFFEYFFFDHHKSTTQNIGLVGFEFVKIT